MDPGPEGKLSAEDYGLSDLDPDGCLHAFRLSADGKETGLSALLALGVCCGGFLNPAHNATALAPVT